MPIFRHPLQRFDANATFVFTKRLRVGEGKNPWVAPGDVVDKVKYAAHLKKWWVAQLIRVQDWTPATGRVALRAKQEVRMGRTGHSPAPVPGPAPSAEPAEQPREGPSAAAVSAPAAELTAPVSEIDTGAPVTLTDAEVEAKLKTSKKGHVFGLPNGQWVKGKAAAIVAMRAYLEKQKGD